MYCNNVIEILLQYNNNVGVDQVNETELILVKLNCWMHMPEIQSPRPHTEARWNTGISDVLQVTTPGPVAFTWAE